MIMRYPYYLIDGKQILTMNSFPCMIIREQRTRRKIGYFGATLLIPIVMLKKFMLKNMVMKKMMITSLDMNQTLGQKMSW